ncbi:MAG: hypothetical protein HKN18_01030 [Silicimonas sp.]|nr:hypothetical protein [Silicimonas sp.]
MEQGTSDYQSLKILLAEYVPIDRDLLHIAIGLVLTMIAVVMARRSVHLKPFLGALAIACLLGAAMEILDMRDDIQSLGAWRWRASAMDFIRTIFVPVIGLFIVILIRRNRSL